MNKNTKTLLQWRATRIILNVMKYTDAHCHILTTPCDTIAGQICNATDEADWQKLIEIANTRTHVCIGIHPWHISSASDGWERRMREILGANPHIMVGEIGIDKYHPNIERQIEFFTRQIEIATEFNRPAHLHIVGAWDKALHILKGRKSLPPIVAHAFGGNDEIMVRLTAEHDVYFSYKMQNGRINNTIKNAPTDKILIESDCDAPTTQPQILANTTREIAKILGRSVAEINAQINTNFQRVINYV